jgi:cysteine desulfurase
MSRRIYLDYAATTPLDKRVKKAMEPYFAKEFANPSALYAEGVASKKAVEKARTKIARVLECHSDEIVFTSGGTEANNLAIFGIAEWARLRSHGYFFTKKFLVLAPSRSQCSLRRAHSRLPIHIVTTNIEHSSILEPLCELEKRGMAEVTYVPVESDGIVNAEKIINAVKQNTVLVSVQYANNEIGTIQPIRKIAQGLRNLAENSKFEIRNSKLKLAKPVFHVDACQAPLYLNCLVNALGVDLMTLDAHKIYGQKGVGCLYVRRGIKLAPILYGGGQERGLRSTTENVPGIVGFAEALQIASANKEKESERVAYLRDHLYSSVLQNTGIEIVINGSMDKKERLPNNLNISLCGIDTEMLVLKLDTAGIAVSSKSSCLKDERESYVVKALGGFSGRAHSTLRFTLGKGNTKKDIEYTAKILQENLN